MNRTEAERRHHRERVIDNRLDIIHNVFGIDWGFGNKGPGALDKDHLTNCSCWACQPQRSEPRVRDNAWLEYEKTASGFEVTVDGLDFHPD